MYEYETTAGCPFHTTQHRSAVKATTPALDAEFTQFGKAGKMEAQEPLCTLMLFLPFPGHSAVAGTAKEAHTRQRRSQKLFALLLPKVLSPACSFCLPVISGGKEKKEEQQGPFPEKTQHCCRDQQAHAGHAPLHEDRSGTHRETITLRGEETSP